MTRPTFFSFNLQRLQSKEFWSNFKDPTTLLELRMLKENKKNTIEMNFLYFNKCFPLVFVKYVYFVYN